MPSSASDDDSTIMYALTKNILPVEPFRQSGLNKHRKHFIQNKHVPHIKFESILSLTWCFVCYFPPKPPTPRRHFPIERIYTMYTSMSAFHKIDVCDADAYKFMMHTVNWVPVVNILILYNSYHHMCESTNCDDRESMPCECVKVNHHGTLIYTRKHIHKAPCPFECRPAARAIISCHHTRTHLQYPWPRVFFSFSKGIYIY